MKACKGELAATVWHCLSVCCLLSFRQPSAAYSSERQYVAESAARAASACARQYVARLGAGAYALLRRNATLCSFDEQGLACVRMRLTKALHLVDNTDIARASKRKRELTFNIDFGDLTLFQQAQSADARSSPSLITSGVAWFAAAAVLAFLFSFRKALSGWIAGIGGAAGVPVYGVRGVTAPTSAVTVSGVMSFTGHMLQITPLNAIWLITLGLRGLFVGLFNIDRHRHPRVKANGLLINLPMAAAVCAVVASNPGTMVVMAEIMAPCAVFSHRR